jgi:hypothetical protein
MHKIIKRSIKLQLSGRVAQCTSHQQQPPTRGRFTAEKCKETQITPIAMCAVGTYKYLITSAHIMFEYIKHFYE